MRPTTVRALDIWMNGIKVGRWERSGHGPDRLLYAPEWLIAAEGRPLSLSLPFTRGQGGDAQPLRGDVVSAYFENLIPDNERILQRIRERYRIRSSAAFDLLAVIGRDCAGAVQLIPADMPPDDPRCIDALPLEEADVARILRETTLGGTLTPHDDDAFRLSLAGAQEKTALLWHEGRWCIPQRATPSSHIFKLPMGMVGNMRADLSMSVELEWLCMELVREFGLPVAHVEIGRFDDQIALIVERFDRRLSSDRQWWQRLPQEDFCQVLGLPPTLKYESGGGPGIRIIMDVLRGSVQADADRLTFFKAQIVFWMLAATDGHAKNFSIELMAGGRYRLTPLYDILSTYPIQGPGNDQLDLHKAKLAMAVEGRNRHYALREIHRWHWVGMAEKLGIGAGISTEIDALAVRARDACDAVGNRLPPGFPMQLFDATSQGFLRAAQQLAEEPDQRSHSGN